MKIDLITIGKKIPGWVKDGCDEYLVRLPKEFKLNIILIPTIKRENNSNIEELKRLEAKQILAKIPPKNFVIALDEHGIQVNTQGLAKKMQDLREQSKDISIIIGGPDGLHQDCLNKANFKWSLSKLTLPHQLVKIFVVEQIYRAWTILCGHPYHR